MLRGLQGVVSHSVVVYEGKGFRASMIRSIATSVTSRSHPGFPHRVFGSLADAVRWMCDGRTAQTVREIEEVVQRLRAPAALAPERRSKEPSLHAPPR
jgi:hypothetical protein